MAAEASRRLGGLKRLREAVAAGSIKNLTRGLAYRLIESGGVIDRRDVQGDLTHLSGFRAGRRDGGRRARPPHPPLTTAPPD